MPDLLPSPIRPPALLSLDEQVLLRTWIRGVPLAALDTPVNTDAFALLARLRLRLFLKATRLQYPDPELWLKRHHLQTWENAALTHLASLMQQADILPSPEHPLGFWLAPDWTTALRHVGLTTLDSLIAFRFEKGSKWWQAIPKLGRVSARSIEQSLTELFPESLQHVKLPPLLPYRTDLVPLDRFLLPEALSGVQGRNRAEADPFIPLQNDLAAIQAWLSLRDPNSHTYRSYQREAERLLLWTVLLQRKAFSDLDALDLAHYRGFMKEPDHEWIGPPQHKNHPHWKPFTGPLALRSIKQSETILTGLFNFLVQQRYLAHNPLSATPRLKTPTDQVVLGVHRAFSPEQWSLITTTVQQAIQNSSGQSRRQALRTEFILHLAYATGLRLHELTNATVGDLFSITRPSSKQAAKAGSVTPVTITQQWLKVLGKGQKIRQVPLPPTTMTQLNTSYQALTGQVLARQPPDYPLIPSLHNASLAVTPLAIHKTLKAFFTRLGKDTLNADPATAQQLLKASAHWLRHTHGSVAVEQGVPLIMIRDNLGHASIATTSHYLHTEADARYDAFKQLTEPADQQPK